jgi:transposase
VAEKDKFMAKRIHANGQASVQARYNITGGCDTDKNIIVAAIYHAETGSLEAKEFRQHQADALRAAEWFRSHQVELVIIESTANYHMLYYDTLREEGINISVINPIVVKALLRVEGKSDKGDAMTLARLAANFDLKTSNMPDSQQRELRLLFKRIDSWKQQRTQVTNRANGILTGHGFTVFRLVTLNTPAGLRILQAIIDRRTPEEIAALHRNRNKRPEIEKCAAVPLPDYMFPYLAEVIEDVNMLNNRIIQAEHEILDKISSCHLEKQVELMSTVSGVTSMLALRIIAELGANYHQRYCTAEAFSKAIGVVPANEVSGGKLLKRRSSHGNSRVKFHLLSAAKAFAIHGKGPLKAWFDQYRGRVHYYKATSALARRIAEALWWVMVKNEPYRHWHDPYTVEKPEPVLINNRLIDLETGEVLESFVEDC